MPKKPQVAKSRPRVALGVSGGVDSSLAAHLLVKAGYDVTGVYLECWRAPGCRTEEDRKDALAVALQLGIPFQVLDFKQAYKDTVVEYFFDEYARGRTPNPDVMCNKEVKFGLFYDWAMKQGFDAVATGHYAQILQRTGKAPALMTSVDERKDQTYFLYRLRDDQLPHILFPVGHLTKKEVRAEAKKRKIPVAGKKDSVGICFIGDINVHSFLKERLGENPGDVVDTSGNVIGRHKGLWFYTIGQRHGFTIRATTKIRKKDGSTVNKHNIPPFYVVRKVPAANQLVVGFGAETRQRTFTVNDVQWIDDIPLNEKKLLVRIRHTGELHPAELQSTPRGMEVVLAQPITGIAEGQSAVFYTSLPRRKNLYKCWGGGVIENPS